MKINNYIFLTQEGYTYQSNSEYIEPDIENLQVIGIASGENSLDAFNNLLIENEYLKETNFDNVFSYRLWDNYKETYTEHSIKEYIE